MKRAWRIWLIAGGCAVLAIVMALVRPGEREPVYKGKKLSEWIHDGPTQRLQPADRAAKIEAIRQIGTNALPCLLKWIEAGELPKPPSTVDSVVIKVVPKATARSWLKYRSKRFWRGMEAHWAFEVLGSDASPAVPELVRLSHSTNGWVPDLASSALDNMEQNATTALREYIEAAKQAARGGVSNSPAAAAPAAAPGSFALGHLMRTNSRAWVPEEGKSTNSRP